MGYLKILRNNLYKKVVNQPIAFFSDQRKGDIMSRMIGDVNEYKLYAFSIRIVYTWASYHHIFYF